MKDIFKLLKKKITGITDSSDAHRIRVIINRMESLVKTSSSENIKITEWDKRDSENKEQWAYSPEQKTIYYPVEGDFAIAKLRDEHIISILLHEISHSKFTEKPNVSFSEPRYAFVQMINAFEDVRVEKKLMLEYPGTYDSLKNFSDIIEKSVPKEQWAEKPDYINYLLNVLRTEWGREQIIKNEKVQEALKNTEQAIKKATEANSTSEMIEKILIPEVWSHLKKLIQNPPPNNKQQQETDNAENNNKSKQSEEKKDNEGSKNKEEQEEKKDEESKNKEEEFKGVSNIKEVIEKAVNKEQLPQQPSSNIKQKPDSEEKERKKAKSDIKLGHCYSSYKKTYEEQYIEIEPYIHYFAKKLNSIMIDNQLKRKGGSFKTGKLNNKKLYKWKCRSNRLFAKDIFRLHKAYSVTLLIDESGSMGGKEIENASLSAVLLAEVLDFVGIPFEVVGFNETVRVYKKINESFSWSKKRNMENIIPSPNTEDGGYTNDAYAINRAVNRLKYREGEKIIIVLTDGSTNASYGGIPIKDREGIPISKKMLGDLDLKEEIHFAQNKNIIIGIGINTDYVKHIYPHHTSINKVSELPRLVLGQVKKSIKRG